MLQDVQIGRSVSALRGDRSQQSLADAMRARGHKWSQATVWGIEKGERPLRLSEAADVVQILGGDVSLLLGADGSAVQSVGEIRERLGSTSTHYMAFGKEGVEMFLERSELAAAVADAVEAGHGDDPHVREALDFVSVSDDEIWESIRSGVEDSLRRHAEIAETRKRMNTIGDPPRTFIAQPLSTDRLGLTADDPRGKVHGKRGTSRKSTSKGGKAVKHRG